MCAPAFKNVTLNKFVPSLQEFIDISMDGTEIHNKSARAFLCWKIRDEVIIEVNVFLVPVYKYCRNAFRAINLRSSYYS